MRTGVVGYATRDSLTFKATNKARWFGLSLLPFPIRHGRGFDGYCIFIEELGIDPEGGPGRGLGWSSCQSMPPRSRRRSINLRMNKRREDSQDCDRLSRQTRSKAVSTR